MVNERFFAQDDDPSVVPARDFVGYGEHPPKIAWEHGAKVAVQIVLGYEEGAEKSYAMGDEENDVRPETPATAVGKRDLSSEAEYEYGSRAGIWRLFRILDAAGVPVSVFAVAVALERNPAVARKIVQRGDEVVGHGYRWTSALDMTRDEEREAIRRTVESIEATTGQRPVGWFSRKMGPNTRELVVEEGGFEYDAETFNDDLPYWTRVNGKAHLVVPYTTVVNDARFVMVQGSPHDFFEYAKASLDRLRNDGDDVSRMMSIGLHTRLIGNPARADALARFLEYAKGFEDVWIARRCDIARVFREQVPPETLAGLG